MPCAKVQSHILHTKAHHLPKQTARMDTLFGRDYEDSLSMAASHHIHQHTWAQKMHERGLFHVFILSRTYSAPGVSQDLQYYLPIITAAPKTGAFFMPNV